MSENYNPIQEKKKKPTFLLVLLVLTGLSLLSTFFSGVVPIISGPMNAEELAQEELDMAKTISEAKKMFSDEDLQEQVEVATKAAFEKIRFVHTRVFWPYHLLLVLVFSLGAFAVYFMFHLKKTGFHLYIIYCIAAVGMNYLVFPQTLIETTEILGSFIVSGVFVFLYGLNLKHFDQPEDKEEGYNYMN
jgi:hypothetical protein